MATMATKPAAPAAGAATPAAHSFSKDQIDEYRGVFDEADEDKSGSIETAELKAVIVKCGMECTDAQVREMIKEADTDNSGTLDFEEFLVLMWRLQSGPSEREVRNEIFVMLDDNMDGFVNLAELKALFVKANADTRGGIAIPVDAVLKQMIAEAAADGTQMTSDDFAAVMEAIA